jgi:hypothetical protein
MAIDPKVPHFTRYFRASLQLWASWGWCMNLNPDQAQYLGSSGEPDFALHPDI